MRALTRPGPLGYFAAVTILVLLTFSFFPFAYQIISEGDAADNPAVDDGTDDATDTRFLTGSVDDWLMQLNGPRHTGFSASIAPESNATFWSWRECNCSIPNMTTPLIIGDRVYSPGSHSTIQCLDLTNGTPYWNFSTGKRMMYATPTFYKGRLYFGNANGTLFCALAHNGSIVWTYPTTALVAIRSSPVVVNDRAYFASPNGYVYCFNAFTGQLIWNRHIGPVSAALAYDEGRLFVSTAENKMFCFNEMDRTEIWNRSYEASFVPEEESAPLLVKDYVLVGTRAGGYLHCLWRSNGTERWKLQIGSTISTPTYGYDTVFIPTLTGKIYRVNLNGTKVWEHDFGSEISSSISIADNKLFFTTFWGDLCCLRVSDHIKVWNHSISDHRYGSRCTPAVAYNMVVAILGDGYLHAWGNYAKTDYTPPGVVYSGPYNGQTGVDINSSVTVRFSENINLTSIIAANFILKNNTGSEITGTLTYDPATNLTSFDPPIPLQYTQTYTFKVSSNVRDLSGLNLDGDGDGSFEGIPHDDFILVFSTQVKNAPAFKPIPMQSFFEDKENVIDLSQYIKDQDTPWANLNITHDSKYANLTGNLLTFKYPNGVFGETVNISVSDGTYLVFQHVQVEVIPVNDPPTIEPLPTIILTEDIPYELNLSIYVSDIDTDWDGLVLSGSSDTTKLHTSVLGNKMTLIYIQQDGPYPYQDLVLNLSAYDSEFYAYQDVNITAISVNDPPVLSKIPNIIVLTGIPYKIDLEDYLDDVDTKPSDLTALTGSEHVSVSGFILTFEYPVGSDGQDTVNLSVKDSTITIYQDLTITIKSGNKQPSLSSPHVDPEIGTPADEFVFVVTYTDTDAYPDSVTTPVWSDYALVKVHINGIGYDMALASGDLRTGAIFAYNNTFDPGNYTFYFTGDDLTPGNLSESQTAPMQFSVSETLVPPRDDDDSGSNRTMLIGIIIAAIVLVLVFAIIAYFVLFRKKDEEDVGGEGDVAASIDTAKEKPAEDKADESKDTATESATVTDSPVPETETNPEDVKDIKTSNEEPVAKKKKSKTGQKGTETTNEGTPEVSEKTPEQVQPEADVEVPPASDTVTASAEPDLSAPK